MLTSAWSRQALIDTSYETDSVSGSHQSSVGHPLTNTLTEATLPIRSGWDVSVLPRSLASTPIELSWPD